jgi:uncharacterized protein/heat shock protein HslJ
MWERKDRSGRRAWRFGVGALSLSTALWLAEDVAVAQSPPTEVVQLSPGAAALTQSGLLDSRTRDDQAYVFRGMAGQVLEVDLRSSNPDVSFTVAPVGPGSALVNSSLTGDNHFTGRLPATGDYTVRVYLQRSASRRVVTATYWLSLAVRAATPPVATTLAGTSWQLVRIQPRNDRTLVLRAGQREKYTLTFGSDGRVAVRADCNRAQGAWMSAGGGQLSLGALESTRAACAPGSLDDRFVRDLSSVRSYAQRGGRLYLSLTGGETYELEPIAATAPEALLRGSRSASASPSFDCGRAISVVEQRICADPRLAARDNQLANVYGESVHRSGGRLEPWLAGSQQAFIARRNDCARSDDQLACLERVYDERIAEVQVRGGLVTSRGPVTFACSDVRGAPDRISATFHQSEPPSVTLERGPERVFAVSGPSGSGVRYEATSVVFWEKGQEAQVRWWGADLRCVPRYR